MAVAQVWPPSRETPASTPLALPFDQRSCCQTPTRFPGFVGLTATHGSTSAFGYSAPLCGAPLQPGVKGVGPVTRVSGDAVSSSAMTGMAGLIAGTTRSATIAGNRRLFP